MSELHGELPVSASHPTSAKSAPGPLKQATLLKFGGGLGIAGTCLGFLIFFAACAGFGAAFKFSFVGVAMGVVGLVFALAGALFQRERIDQETHVLAAVFVTMLAIIGGLFEMAIWLDWTIFAK